VSQVSLDSTFSILLFPDVWFQKSFFQLARKAVRVIGPHMPPAPVQQGESDAADDIVDRWFFFFTCCCLDRILHIVLIMTDFVVVSLFCIFFFVFAFLCFFVFYTYSFHNHETEKYFYLNFYYLMNDLYFNLWISFISTFLFRLNNAELYILIMTDFVVVTMNMWNWCFWFPSSWLSIQFVNFFDSNE
jgi:hypothetical protein